MCFNRQVMEVITVLQSLFRTFCDGPSKWSLYMCNHSYYDFLLQIIRTRTGRLGISQFVKRVDGKYTVDPIHPIPLFCKIQYIPNGLWIPNIPQAARVYQRSSNDDRRLTFDLYTALSDLHPQIVMSPQTTTAQNQVSYFRPLYMHSASSSFHNWIFD